ncbi:MAG: MerR family DNA-binding transcriptional regulator [Rhodospirillales bacterium]|nr:MerR family DNA-binding transcriptional regulator [Rhodospirillales bacterium]
MTRTYGITELANEFGITTRTIRFYEDRGLIKPLREGNRRIYRTRDRVRLKLIMRGKRLGFSIEEISEMINLYDVDRSEVTQLRLVLDKIEQRSAALKQHSQDIEVTLRELAALEARCSELLQDRERSTASPVCAGI